MITVESVSKSFKNRPAVDDISFAVHEKEILVLLGTSGCGKTTTLKMINRLIESDSGRILIDGKNIKDHNVEQLRMGIGYVMQNSGLFPHYTVAENIAVVPKLQKWNSKKIKDRTEELIQKLHLSGDVLNRFPHELSGGQQQRVGIARALIANTPILLMDEPFGALDNMTKSEIHNEFKTLDELKNKTIILVTHDVSEAFELGHRICLMDKGKIIQIGTPKEMIYRPANDFVKNFFANNRLTLEYQITKISELQFENTSEKRFDEDQNIWNVLQDLSTNSGDAELYNTITASFNEYRQKQLT
ncbi:ABC transporter ATP-binding protein [Chryseobacterium sp. APV1]|uniref:ABC transporter ATP-binding protein n=1 Tax=Chryseobacterium urinae TaxID=3058400 RepID=A0ABT8U5F2_9FLAO|nr:ABC transporter ATP-binding protein [Chryseobacterium sp. APV1]MDO3426288.1 ABC transporter ATP-binding protein [Chryseobacterium sp. APV1]